MEILFIYEPAEEIGMSSRRQRVSEKRIDLQERIACKLLLGLGSRDEMKKRFPPIHHSKKKIGPPAGIGKRIESVCQVNPERLYMGGELSKSPGFGAGLPLALLAVVHPVPQIDPIVPAGVKETSGQAAILVQVAQGPAAEPPDRECRSVLSNE